MADKIPVFITDNTDLDSDWLRIVGKSQEGTEKEKEVANKLLEDSKKGVGNYEVSDDEILVDKKSIGE